MNRMACPHNSYIPGKITNGETIKPYAHRKLGPEDGGFKASVGYNVITYLETGSQVAQFGLEVET